MPEDPPAPDNSPAELEQARRELAEARALATLERARLEAMTQFPLADLETLNALTQPETITSTAQRLHEAASARQQALEETQGQLAQLQRQGQGQPQPPAGGPDPEDRSDRERRVMAMKLRNGTMRKTVSVDDVLPYSGTRQEMGDLFVASWNNHMAHRKRGYGDLDAPKSS